jgi:hypothetical protein
MYGPSKLFKFPEIVRPPPSVGGKKNLGRFPNFFCITIFFLLRPYTSVLNPQNFSNFLFSNFLEFPQIVNPPPSCPGIFTNFFFYKKNGKPVSILPSSHQTTKKKSPTLGSGSPFPTRGGPTKQRRGMTWSRSGLDTTENDEIQRAIVYLIHIETIRRRNYEPAGV